MSRCNAAVLFSFVVTVYVQLLKFLLGNFSFGTFMNPVCNPMFNLYNQEPCEKLSRRRGRRGRQYHPYEREKRENKHQQDSEEFFKMYRAHRYRWLYTLVRCVKMCKDTYLGNVVHNNDSFTFSYFLKTRIGSVLYMSHSTGTFVLFQRYTKELSYLKI